MTKQEIESHWNEILEVITKIEMRREHLVIIGDTNRLIGNIVNANNEKISFYGKLIRNFLKDGEYKLVNSSSKVKGGIWTREDPADKENKSVLDIVIVSSALEKYVKVMEVDSERKFTSFKQIKGGQLSFPDHYSLKVTFKGIP